MKKLALALLVAGVALLGTAAPALATKNDPHHEQTDGCDHGHTGRPCRPDPQPTHGKDCLDHGRHGGVNEDHCLPTTTTTRTSTTITTTTTSSTEVNRETTTTTSPGPGTTVTTTGAAAPPVVVTSPAGPHAEAPGSVTCLDATGYAYVTGVDTGCLAPAVQVSPSTSVLPASVDQLPRTGASSLLLALAGMSLLGAGLICLTLRRALAP